ncbi:heavy metal translocating P-type ATPase [Elstera cyanobacteriorum]|uniref:heavy metal translocating P-type ATPase n=1 Tax=Elstera cyanobacteriorum TaxID=2022747 RepID=UPI002354DA29|nr:heavy metal translocating P-type ATPase [Elstera cyanobacteriorum]MCK6444243.1 cadmium-translocating P-type ATPase [Elstera cyanobacteriorum]
MERNETPGATQPLEWTVTGMDCAACATKIRGALERLPGVDGISVAIMTERLKLTLDENQTGRDTVEAAVRTLGYGIVPRAGGTQNADAPATAQDHAACCGHPHDHNHDHDHAHPLAGSDTGSHQHIHDDPADRGKAWYQTGKGQLVVLTGALLGLAWLTEALTSAALGRWAFTTACLIGLAPVARRAFAALRLGQPFTIEALMTIAALGALVINAAEEAALVVFLFAVGEVLEGVAASKARDGIRTLAALVPKTAFLETGDGPQEVPADSLTPGQIILIRPGDRIPADGDILTGTSGIDESPVTGESLPKTRGPGDAVFAGSINTDAVLRVTVTKAAADNTIARIIRLVEEAEEARAPTERFIDRFSRWYMPAIGSISLLVILVPPLAFGQAWDVWIYRGLALLLIGCPCALVISVPAAIAAALSAGARRGVLMKGGAVIEATARVTQVAFDKTGTLTHGRPVVTDIVPLNGTPEAEILAVAAAVEAGSSHPLARAILAQATAAGIAPLPSQDARALPGKGASAHVGEGVAWVASPRHAAAEGALDADGLAEAARLEAQGKTAVALFRLGRALGLIALRDEPRADAAEAIRQLKRLGIGTTILTGDNPRTAAAIAGQLGMDYRAEMLPEDKLAAIRRLSEAGGVMMIGDGINDAPALKQADVGVAMGSGTDVALEVADSAILRDRVTDIPAQIRLARAAMSNIHQNIALALGLKAVFLVTSVLGITGLWIAILADTGATVLVTLNALRLLGFQPEERG